MLILVALLGHHIHTPGAASAAGSGVVVSEVAHQHEHAGVKALQIVDHAALDEIVPELCVVGEQAPPPVSGGHGQVALLSTEPRSEDMLPAPSFVPSWDAPSVAPDVLRALLQVFLN
jgi:hypothetical protein